MNIMHDYVAREIGNLANQFGKKIPDARLQTYAEVVSDYAPQILRDVCKRFARQARMMPTPDEMGRACAQLAEHKDQKKLPLVNDLVCRYFDPTESAASRSLCDRKIEPSDAENGMRQFGQPVCRWHYDILYVKVFPDSNRQLFIDQMLKSAAMKTAVNPKGLSQSLRKMSETKDRNSQNTAIASILAMDRGLGIPKVRQDTKGC